MFCHVLQMAMAEKSGKKPDVIVISDDEDSLDSCRSRQDSGKQFNRKTSDCHR